MMTPTPLMFETRYQCTLHMYAVSGTIGAGKSTALKMCAETPHLLEELNVRDDNNRHLVIVQEPVDVWRDQNWLQRYYAEPKKLALPFQFLVFCTHVKKVQDALSPWKDDSDAVVFCLVERSMWDQLLFWKLQMELSGLDSMFDEAYMHVWNMWMQFLPPIDHIFYFATSTLDKTLERVWKRGRREELGVKKSCDDLPTHTTLGTLPTNWKKAPGIDYTYHAALWQKHEDWYNNGQSSIHGNDFRPACLPPITRFNMDAAIHLDDQLFRGFAAHLALVILGDDHTRNTSFYDFPSSGIIQE